HRVAARVDEAAGVQAGLGRTGEAGSRCRTRANTGSADVRVRIRGRFEGRVTPARPVARRVGGVRVGLTTTPAGDAPGARDRGPGTAVNREGRIAAERRRLGLDGEQRGEPDLLRDLSRPQVLVDRD